VVVVVGSGDSPGPACGGGSTSPTCPDCSPSPVYGGGRILSAFIF
jgi:hypothetical protein